MAQNLELTPFEPQNKIESSKTNILTKLEASTIQEKTTVSSVSQSSTFQDQHDLLNLAKLAPLIEKLRLPKGLAKWSTDDLSEMLKDVTFVDFFNVFLCQPIFAQRMLYKSIEKEFELEPSISKVKFFLDHRKLAQWVAYQRLPYFAESSLAEEYIISRDLLSTTPLTSASAHGLFYDHYSKVADMHFLQECVGNVRGMCKFRDYLHDTPGHNVIMCLTDIRKFHRIRRDDKAKRCSMFREIQVKYFKLDGPHTRPDSLWEPMSEVSNSITLVGLIERSHKMRPNVDESRTSIDEILDDDHVTEEEIEDLRFHELEKLLLAVLKDYWLQKYLLHCKSIERCKEATEQPEATRSDLALQKGLENIDKALAVLHSTSSSESRIRAFRAQRNWRAMFPENTVDDSFLNCSDEIVTIHKDGMSSVEKMNSSKFERMMRKYLEYYSSDSEPEEDFASPPKSVQTDDKWTRDIELTPELNQLKSSASGDVLMRRINMTEEAVLGSKTIKSNLAINKQLLGLNFETIPQTQTDTSAEINTSKKESKNDTSSNNKQINGRVVISDEVKNGADNDQKEAAINHNTKTRHAKDTSAKTSKDPTKMRQRQRPNVFKDKRKLAEDDISDMTETYKLDIQIERSMSHAKNSLDARTFLPKIQDKEKVMKIKHADFISTISTQAQRETDLLQKETFTYKNICKGYYRFDNRDFINAIVSDNMAGQPFERFLRRNKHFQALSTLYFLLDSHEYLTSKLIKSDSVADYVKYRRSKALVMKYLGSDENCKLHFLPPDAIMMLRCLLPTGKGDDLISCAQDLAYESLRSSWRAFVQVDTSGFCTILQYMRTTHVAAQTSSDITFTLDKKRVVSSERLEELTVLDLILETSQIITKSLISDFWSDSHRRKILALQLSMIIAGTHDPRLPLETLKIADLDVCLKSYGSLSLNKLVIEKRRDLIEEWERQQKMIALARRKRLDLIKSERNSEIARLSQKSSDALNTFMKPFKKAGKWYCRPPKPSTLMEILKDPMHLEFFKRYISLQGNDVPLMFIVAVEELKKVSNRHRQQKINAILRRFFSAKGVKNLDYDNDVIREITRLQHVQAAMLVSAQASVIRSMEEKWFNKYCDTFEQSESETKVTEAIRILATRKAWGRESTKMHWMLFVRKVLAFRRGLLNPQSFKMFVEFLRHEVKKECSILRTEQKTAAGQSYVIGMPLKKIINNKLVDVIKLANDASFLAEAERYRIICDDAQTAAEEGSYSVNNNAMLEIKAKTIVECYLDSEIPPKILVNVSQSMAETVVEMLKNKILDRSLFHDCCSGLFSHLIFYWRKFQSSRFMSYNPTTDSDMLTDSTVESKSITSADLPDYINITSLRCKKVAGHFEDDSPRILFSILHGARFVIPYTRPDYFVRREIKKTAIPTSIARLPRQNSILFDKDSSSVLDQMLDISRQTSALPGFSGATKRISIAPNATLSIEKNSRKGSVQTPSDRATEKCEAKARCGSLVGQGDPHVLGKRASVRRGSQVTEGLAYPPHEEVYSVTKCGNQRRISVDHTSATSLLRQSSIIPHASSQFLDHKEDVRGHTNALPEVGGAARRLNNVALGSHVNDKNSLKGSVVKSVQPPIGEATQQKDRRGSDRNGRLFAGSKRSSIQHVPHVDDEDPFPADEDIPYNSTKSDSRRKNSVFRSLHQVDKALRVADDRNSRRTSVLPPISTLSPKLSGK